MKLFKKDDGQAKQAKRHFNQCGITKISPEHGSQRLRVSISHFLPEGGAEMYASSTERVYFSISGSLMVKNKKGDEYLVEPGDVLFIPPGEERSIKTFGNKPATMLVVVVNLD